MARPTVTTVYAAAADHAGDFLRQFYVVTVPSKLDPFFALAYSELFRAMQKYQSTRARQENYYNLPAYTSVLDPATAGIANLGELESIGERGGVTSVAISGVAAGAGAATVTTSTPHGRATGDQIVQFGIIGMTDDVNGQFTITVTGASSYTANGCTATGTYSSGGTMAFSTEEFTDVVPGDTSEALTSSTQLGIYSWKNDIIRFPPCSALRQLKIAYSLSGAAPSTTNATVPIDDSLDFLATRTAGLALASRGNRPKADTLNLLAVGQPADWARGIPGGILDQLLAPGVRNLQRLPPSQRRIAPWRQRRRTMAW